MLFISIWHYLKTAGTSQHEYCILFKIVAATVHSSNVKLNKAIASCSMFSNVLLVTLLQFISRAAVLLLDVSVMSISVCFSDMTAIAGPRPCPFRRTVIRTWTMMMMRRGVPLLPWGGELHRPPQCPTANHHLPPSALPTMMKCSPFCRPTWMSWPGLTNTRWLNRHGEAPQYCQQLQDGAGLGTCIHLGDTCYFIDFIPVVVWILRVMDSVLNWYLSAWCQCCSPLIKTALHWLHLWWRIGKLDKPVATRVGGNDWV